MKKFTVTLAYDVPCYAEIKVEAEDAEQAKQKALAEAWNHVFEPMWDGAGDYRVVDTCTKGRDMIDTRHHDEERALAEQGTLGGRIF